MIRKILCLLGFHNWIYHLGADVRERGCVFCDNIQEGCYDGMSIDWMNRGKGRGSNKALESHAANQHAIWSHWMKYFFSVCTQEERVEVQNGHIKRFKTGNLVISKDNVERWKRQMNTDYDQLSEKEKDSDRNIVREFY